MRRRKPGRVQHSWRVTDYTMLALVVARITVFDCRCGIHEPRSDKA